MKPPRRVFARLGCGRHASATNWPNLLFRNGHRHLTAETLHAEAVAQGIKVSLATVYNTLHQFTHAGLLRQVVVDPTRSYFDTNTVDHQHFYYEDEGMLTDIPGSGDCGRRVAGAARRARKCRASMSWCGCARNERSCDSVSLE